MVLQDRARPRRFRQIVRGQDQAEPAQVHLAGRADRPARARTSSRSRCRRSTSRASASASKQQGGVGQGEGEAGDAVGAGRASEGAGQGRQRRRASTSLEVEVTLDELAADPGRRAELPRIQPKGKQHDHRRRRTRYIGHPPRRPRVAAPLQAHLQARRCKRADRDGHLRPRRTRSSCPIREDKRYRSWKTEPLPRDATRSSST